MLAILFFILEDILLYFSTSSIIVLILSTTTSILTFLGLSLYRKSLTINGVIISAVLGFFVMLPLSLSLGPIAAIIIGVVMGLLQFKFKKLYFIIPIVIISIILFVILNYIEIYFENSIWSLAQL